MELLVYKASAGSGKTFTLAVEYIKHLMLNPRAYKQILAVTFTNKATGEMKERILQQLYGIWVGDPKSDAYLKEVKARLNKPTTSPLKGYSSFPKEESLGETGTSLTDDELRQRAGLALKLMLHDYSRFRVETIDSFFQSVMRNLARELELSPNLNIELNNAEVLSDAVDSLIEKLSPTSPVLAWLLDYINERIAEDKRWNVSDEIKNFGRNIFDECYIERGEALRQLLQTPQALKLYRDTLRLMEKKALEEMKGYYDEFIEDLEAHGLEPDELKGGARGIGSYFRKLRDGKLSEKETQNATLQNCLSDARHWTSKTSPHKDEILELAELSLIPLLKSAERMRVRNNRTLNSCRLSLQHLNQLRLLNHIDEEVRTLNHEHNRFLLSDTNALLHTLMREGDSSFVFEKIGAHIRNVMIDEFQDTSRMQWDNFRLLLLEGLSQGADSLIVGDVKQSIYRWRNGDWRILNYLRPHPLPSPSPRGEGETDRLGKNKEGGVINFPIRVETLKVNRRSEANIIHFNNAFFQEAVKYLNGVHLDELHEECLPLKHAYADVAQESPKHEERGYVKVSFLEGNEEHDYSEVTLMRLGEEVKRLLDEGVRMSQIAILVRKNKAIPPIADYFDRELQLPIVSDEAFRLDASQAVSLLVDALRYLSNPEDSVARASLTRQYGMLPERFTEQLPALRLMPLYELLEELFNIFEIGRLSQQEAYLFSFFDAVTEYLQNNSSDPDGFIRHWDEVLCGKTIPGGEVEGIRILSIHKSKGLEFHTVLIPFCDWKMENETANQLVWCTTDEEPYSHLPLVPVNYSATMAESVYRQDYLDERLQLWVDNLNLLYVAFTRAGTNLILWSKKEQKGTVAELLNEVLKPHPLPSPSPRGEGEADSNGILERLVYAEKEGEVTYELRPHPLPSSSPRGEGEADSNVYGGEEIEKKEREEEKEEEKEEEREEEEGKRMVNKLAEKAERMPVRMESLRPNIRFRQSNRSADFIAGVSEEKSAMRFINRGRLLHTLFSAIKTEADIDKAIDRLLFEGVITDHEMEKEIRELTRRAFSLPQVKEWYSGKWRLFNERDIIWQEKGMLSKRRPDRVMMRDGEIVVVDFKFGKPEKRYNKQVLGYMDLLKQMGYTTEKIKGYLWYIKPHPLPSPSPRGEGEADSIIEEVKFK